MTIIQLKLKKEEKEKKQMLRGAFTEAKRCCRKKNIKIIREKDKCYKQIKFDHEKMATGQVTHCIICDETFEQDWIMCQLVINKPMKTIQTEGNSRYYE